MAASRIFSAAWNSPSAMMTRERRSRSASACFAIARTIVSGSETSRRVTAETLIPHGSVEVSRRIEAGDDPRAPGPFGGGKESPETEDPQALVPPHALDRGPKDHEHQDNCKSRRKDESLSRHATHSSDQQGALRE